MAKKLTKEEFISRAEKIHKWSYSYEEVEISGSKGKVKIYCRRHDLYFHQSPCGHLVGKTGCRLCESEKRSTGKVHDLELFKLKMREVSNTVYDYSKSMYKTTHTPMTVGCMYHGYFSIAPSKLLSGRCCPVCSKERQNALSNMGLDRFIERATEFHNGKYSYHMSTYVNQQTQTCICCPDHGPFSQAPAVHLRSGCPECAETGFDESKDGVLYILSVEGIFNFTGFGITRDINTRLSRHVKVVRDSGCFISNKYISKTVNGSIVKQLETILKQTFPLSPCSKDISGFKTESTTAPYKDVVAFCTNYIEENYGSY